MITQEIISQETVYGFTLKKANDLSTLGSSDTGTPAYDELDMIVAVASPYEDIHYPIEFTTIKL